MEKVINKKKNKIKAGIKIKASRYSIKFTKKNYYTFAGGLISILLGYILLANGSIVAAPLLLILGYIVIIPVSIFIK